MALKFPVKPDPWDRMSKFEFDRGWVELLHRSPARSVSPFAANLALCRRRPFKRGVSAWDEAEAYRNAAFAVRMTLIHRSPIQ